MTAEKFSSLQKYVKRPHIYPIPSKESLNSNKQKCESSQAFLKWVKQVTRVSVSGEQLTATPLISALFYLHALAVLKILNCYLLRSRCMPYGVWATKNEGVYSHLDVWGIPEHQEKNISLRVKGGNTFLFDYRAYGSDIFATKNINQKSCRLF